MRLEFIVLCDTVSVGDLGDPLVEKLAEVLLGNGNEADIRQVSRMIEYNFSEKCVQSEQGGSSAKNKSVVVFSVDLPDDILQVENVVEEFVANVTEIEEVYHLVKFEDDFLLGQLKQWAEEIYSVEMKLRRVLSVIYLKAYGADDPYSLFHEESTKPGKGDKIDPEQMKAAMENQFFHLLFSDYVGLNNRPSPKLDSLVGAIRDSVSYEALQAELRRQPISHEKDQDLLAGLKERLDPIEKMRNCVAHNRRPSKKIREAYITALPEVHRLLDEYLHREDEVVAPDWEIDARDAVRGALARLDFKAGSGAIEIQAIEKLRARRDLKSREDLEQYLVEIADEAYYGSVPSDGGAAAFECDTTAIVSEELEEYEEQIEKVFDGEKENRG